LADISDEADRLVKSLFDARSLLDQLRGTDPRRQSLARLATLGELLVVPRLLHLFAADDPLSEEAARTIATLVEKIGPTELARIDQQARSYSCTYGGSSDDWWTLSPVAVSRLQRVSAAYPAALGVASSHPNGYVREAVVKALGTHTAGREIPFLALRANDWVWPVAARAGELLARRLVPDNQPAVLTALPFLVRMLSQRRQDHTRFTDALRAVLVSDGGRHVLSRLHEFDRRVRRFVYELVGSNTPAADSMLRPALADADAAIRRSAIRRLAALWDIETSTPILENMLMRDHSPAVRKEALTLLAERRPERVRQLLPHVLLDRSARVRELARFCVRDLEAPIVPRNFYIAGLANTSTLPLSTAIAGLGETGSSTDVELLASCLNAVAPRVRRAALIASARLDPGRGIPMALTALADAAPSVRTAAVHVLAGHSRHVNFAIVRNHLHGLGDPATRRKLLHVVKEAPKWDAVVLLLEVLGDPDDGVRRKAAELLGDWVTGFNRQQAPPGPTHLARIRSLLEAHESRIDEATASLLRFSLRAADS